MDPKMNFSNQFKLLAPEAARPVTLIGAGAVGSYVAVELAKMGVPKLVVYDDDSVESANLPMSAYRQKDLGRSKVAALREIVEEASGLVIDERPVRYVDGPLEGAVVACVDSMEARQAIWRYVEWRSDVDLLIDTRTAAELLWVFAIDPDDPDDIDLYRPHVAYSTKEAAIHACGVHGIAPVSLRAAAAVGSNLTSWWQEGRKTMDASRARAAAQDPHRLTRRPEMKFRVRIDPTHGQSREQEIEAPPSSCSVKDVCAAGGIDPKNMSFTANGKEVGLDYHVTPADDLAARDRNAPTVTVSERPRGS